MPKPPAQNSERALMSAPCASSTSTRGKHFLAYSVFFILGIVLHSAVPGTGHLGSVTLIIISMYGGGFSTIPAYIADIFGTRFVGGIHGRILTAWSAAGVFGPVIVNYIRQYQIDHGVAKADAYTGDDVHHGGAARRRLPMQLLHPPGA
jgi:hypothetical protein